MEWEGSVEGWSARWEVEGRHHLPMSCLREDQAAEAVPSLAKMSEESVP